MKVNKFFSIIAAGILAVGAYSCTDDIKYDPAGKVEGEGVCFDASIGSEMEIPTDATEIPITVSRSTKAGEYTVDVTASVTDDSGEPVEGVFTLPTSVTFADGELSAVYTIGVNFANVVPDVSYHLSLKLPENVGTPYGPGEVNTVLLYSPWSELLEQEGEVFVITGSPFNGNDYTQIWGKANSLVDENQWLVYIPTPFSNVEGLNWSIYINTNEDRKMTVDGQEVYWCTTDIVDTQYNGYGLADSYSWFLWLREQLGRPATPEEAEAWIAKNDRQHSYFNPVTGVITVNVAVFALDEELGTWYPSASDPWIIQLPGYTAPYVKIQDLGNYVDATGYETKQFSIVKNSIVESVKFKLLNQALEGEALTAAINELAADEEAVTITENNILVSYELIEDQDYTLLAVGLNAAGEVSCSDSKVFKYNSIQRPDGFKTVGMVNFTDGVLLEFLKLADVNETMKVELQQSENEEGLYRLKNPYREWAKDAGIEKMVMSGNYYIYLNAKDKRMVYIPESSLGLQNNLVEGPVNIYSEAARLLASGRTPAYIKLQKKCGTLTNNVITFPAKTVLAAYGSDIPDWTEVNTRGTFRVELTPAAAEGEEIAPVNVRKHIRSARAMEMKSSVGAPVMSN